MPKISPDLMSVLRCPVTGSALTQEGEELVSTATDENGQNLRYAIEDGIPLLLPPELLAAANAARSGQHDGPGQDPAAPAAPETPTA
ncbi:Trm112 family protein [Arthrobacter sp. D1-17]